MSAISVPYLNFINHNTTLQAISAALDKLERNSIKRAPWNTLTENPEVSFAIAYSYDGILLKYYVHEKSIRGLHSFVNTPVHEDSCLEFFISFDGNEEYYNLEFNCIGTCLFGYGKEREHRKMLNEETINQVRRLIIIEHAVNSNGNPVYWELVAAIPTEVFVHNNITNLKGRDCKVNFYKCGDQLTEPHFLAWNNIIATSPDFHLPEFFGNLHFA